MAQCQGTDMDEGETPDFTFNPAMLQGRLKQRCLWQFGFQNTYAAQLDQAKHEAMQAVPPAWNVVLERTPLDSQLVCTLLSVSCGMRHTVHLLCAGQLSVELWNWTDKQRKLRSFARWLPRHAALLAHLDTEDIISTANTAAAPSMEAVLARAMWEAGSKLQLGSCAFHSEMLVQQVALLPNLRTRLTSLTFAPKGGMSASEAQPVIAALRQLTALESLTCHGNGPRSINSLLPALPGLTKLTRLSAGFNRRAELSKYLPVSLVQLYIGSVPAAVDAASKPLDNDDDPDADRYLPPCAASTGQPFSLNLSHLTAVTYLDFLWEGAKEEWTALYLWDELPPNTRMLYAGVEHGAALAVLCPLQKLTYLDLHFSGVTAADLQVLTCLTNLEMLHMREFSFDEPNYAVLETPHDYCAAWPLLPIYNVTVNGIVTPYVLQNVAETTRLTTLVLHYERGSHSNMFRLADALKPLKELHELSLAFKPNHSGVHWWSDEAKLSCVSALLELPELSSLWLRELPLSRAAAEVIGQLQQLTALRLVCCDVDDYCVNVIALTLTGLENLSLDGNKKVTDASMPTVGKLMRELTYINLCHTRITQVGLACLQQLPLLTSA